MDTIFIITLVLTAAFAIYCVVDVFNQTRKIK